MFVAYLSHYKVWDIKKTTKSDGSIPTCGLSGHRTHTWQRVVVLPLVISSTQTDHLWVLRIWSGSLVSFYYNTYSPIINVLNYCKICIINIINFSCTNFIPDTKSTFTFSFCRLMFAENFQWQLVSFVASASGPHWTEVASTWEILWEKLMMQCQRIPHPPSVLQE